MENDIFVGMVAVQRLRVGFQKLTVGVQRILFCALFSMCWVVCKKNHQPVWCCRSVNAFVFSFLWILYVHTLMYIRCSSFQEISTYSIDNTYSDWCFSISHHPTAHSTDFTSIRLERSNTLHSCYELTGKFKLCQSYFLD